LYRVGVKSTLRQQSGRLQSQRRDVLWITKQVIHKTNVVDPVYARGNGRITALRVNFCAKPRKIRVGDVRGTCLPLARVVACGAQHARPPSSPSVQGSVVVDDSREDGGRGSGGGSAITGSGEDGGEESPPSLWRIMGVAGMGSSAGGRGSASGDMTGVIGSAGGGSIGAGTITITGSGAGGGAGSGAGMVAAAAGGSAITGSREDGGEESPPSLSEGGGADGSGSDDGMGSGAGSAITGSGEDGGEESPPSPAEGESGDRSQIGATEEESGGGAAGIGMGMITGAGVGGITGLGWVITGAGEDGDRSQIGATEEGRGDGLGEVVGPSRRSRPAAWSAEREETFI
jgi:hypothetical protein